MTADEHGGVVTVMIAVNPRLFSDALTHSLQRSVGIKVVQHGAPGGVEAVEVFGRVRPDVALLDYYLPGLDGPAVTEAIRLVSPNAKVLLMSGIFGPDHVERALLAGAVGFLPKGLSVAQVVDSIRQAHRGCPLVHADEVANLVDVLNARIRDGDDLYARYATLTDRELEILRQLAEGRTNIEVATTLGVSAGTLKNHLTRIFTKTGAASRMEVIDTAQRTGLILRRRPSRL